jgi:hypothetical protein
MSRLVFVLSLICPLSLQAADVVAVCPAEFQAALRPWVEHRAQQGYTIATVANATTAEEQRRAIRERVQPSTRFLLLVGDVDRIPAHFAEAKVNVRWGSEPQIATDNWYADLDDDQTPDLAVGRLTADSPAQLSAMVRKIVAYETAANSGAWRQRINFIAGLGGFGGLADAAIEACAKKLICDGVPAAYQTTMTYASWRSPYCPDPRRFGRTAIDRLNEGCLFWVYLGHGHAWGLDRVQVPGGQFPILDLADVRQVRCMEGSPIALLMACHSGAFDARQDCLAEEMLRSEIGPTAVLCGSRVTMPYAIAVLCGEALKECFQQRRTTLGEMLLHAKRNTILRPRTDPESQTLDTLAATINAGSDLLEERREHLHLFNLLGDPLLRLPHPREITLAAPGTIAPGGEVTLQGTSELNGVCTIELVVPRDRLTFRPAIRREFEPTHTALSAYQETYLKANDGRLVSTQTISSAGKFSARLVVPEDARGDCYLRAFISNDRDCAHGAAPIRIAPVQTP